MIRKVMYICFIFCFLTGCGSDFNPYKLQSAPVSSTEKKVILIVADSLLDEPLQTLMKQNKVPAFSFLKENGWYTNQMISSFPTMSVTIDSTLLTGSYPDKHHIPGLRWYDTSEKRMINYGDGLSPIMKSGIQQVMMDSLFRLNNTHLSKEVVTIHEELAKKGYPTASINALVHRGNAKQTLHIPGPFKDIQTMGPTHLVLGNFLHDHLKTNPKDQYFNKYGINNHVSIQHLVQLIQKNSLPSFTMVYFPDLDHESHENGRNLTDSIVKVDKQLQTILNSFGSWTEAIRNHVFLIMGDSGVSKIKETKKEALIDLDHLFGAMRIAKPEETKRNDDLVLALNERMAYVYPLHPNIKEPDLMNMVKNDPRLDTISWKDKDWVNVIQGGTSKQLKFRPGSTYTDPYTQTWDIQGDLSVLDLKVDERKNQLTYGQYPDGLMRLYSAAHSQHGRFMILTANPGYEMKGGDSTNHVGGGAHGSFHEVDSYFPMFIAGTDKRPKTLRIVDLKSFILDVAG